MPFAQLPSSPGFQMPPTPRWEPFALEAIRAIERRPIPPLAAMVQNSVNQINQILQLQSPIAKMQRQMQMTQMAAMQSFYQDWMSHKNDGTYMMTANGPILAAPYQAALKLKQAQANRDNIMAAYYGKKMTEMGGGSGPGSPGTARDEAEKVRNGTSPSVSAEGSPPTPDLGTTPPEMPKDEDLLPPVSDVSSEDLTGGLTPSNEGAPIPVP